LLGELRAGGSSGGYTILKDWLHPQRGAANTVEVRRVEDPPGKQAQVYWEQMGTIEMDGQERMRIPPKANADSEGNANGIPGRRRTDLGA
jgi:hypothetical protein